MKLGLVATLLLAMVIGGGCGSSAGDDGLSSSEVKMSSRIDEIAKASGGDWEKVSAADRDYLVKEVAQGSEPSAKMMLQAKAGKLQGGAGGAPKGK